MWTWRAAGARQPKGTVDAAVLPSGASVGDRMKADVEIDLDGHRVNSVTPIRAKGDDPSRLVILGSGRELPAVTTDMKGGLTGEDRRSSRLGRDGARRERTDGAGRGDRGARGSGPRSDRPERSSRPGGDRGARPGPDRGERAARADSPRGARPGSDRGERVARADSPGGDPPRGDRRPGGASAPNRPEGWKSTRPPRERTGAQSRPAPPKAKRLSPKRTHRDAVLAEVAPELRPVAEKVLRGGVAAVRAALDEQNAAARAAGAEEVKADGLLAVAEQLVPSLRVAEWWDRAEAALADVDEISLRDLRSVVAGSDAARDDETRALAASLREALARRLEAESKSWIAEVESSLGDGRVVRALRLSGRPPEPTTRLPAEMATRLSEVAGEALAPESTSDRWIAVLEAVVASPVRRTVQPQGLPTEGGPAVTRAATDAASRVPALAKLLGIPAGVPLPPPGRRAPVPPPRPAAAPAAPPSTTAEAPVVEPQEAAAQPVVVPSAPEPAEPFTDPQEAQVAVPETESEPEPEPATGTPVAEAETSGDDGDDAVLVQELGKAVDQG